MIREAGEFSMHDNIGCLDEDGCQNTFDISGVVEEVQQ